MPRGTLEVLLVGAKGVQGTDYLSNVDPFVFLVCRSQEQRSSVAAGKGYEPKWNEAFVFTISEGVSELILKIMDSASVTKDDFVGEATIPLEAVFMEGIQPTTVYNIVKEQEFRGEIRVGLTFTPEHGIADQRLELEESYGGGKASLPVNNVL